MREKTMTAVKWLLVGAGDIANSRVAPALAQAERSELVAICDVVEERATRLAKRLEVSRVFTNMERALAESGADAVYLAVPVVAHVDLGLQVLNSGKHLLVEKPLGLNGDQALRLAKAAAASKNVSACAFYRRSSGQFQYTKAALARGAIGTPVGGTANYFLHLPRNQVEEGRWFLKKSLAGGGLLCHLGSHVLDILVGLFGAPTSVLACCGAFQAKLDVEDWAAVILRLPNGAPFTFNLNWNSNAPVRHDLEILGSEGRITWPEWPPHGDGPVLVTRGKETCRQEVSNHSNFHLPLVNNFIGAVLDGAPVLCSLGEAAQTNLTIDAVYRSASEHREIAIGQEQAQGIPA
jgi:predicted dehydrogenase